MTFYFAETNMSEQRVLLCRWAERFYNEKRRAQIVADSTAAAQYIDNLLWTFSQSSFIPHAILSRDSDNPTEPVIITIGEIRVPSFDIILCDGPVSLDFMMSFETIVHFIFRDDPEKRQESRLLWQKVRDLGVHPVHVPYDSGSQAQYSR